MRGSNMGGRFSISSEIDRYWEGIDQDLQREVGGEVPWYRYDEQDTIEDDIYSVGSSKGTGREWKNPRPVKYISAHLAQGQTLQREQGFYNADVLRLTCNLKDFLAVFPDIVLKTDSFDRDRIIFNNEVFRPDQTQLLGLVADRYTIVSVTAIEVHEEELVNDTQFNETDS